MAETKTKLGRGTAEERPDVRLQVMSDPRWLCSIRGAVRGYFTSLGLHPDQVESVILAVDEACANSMRHAYKYKPDGVVELTMRVVGNVAEVVVRDFGKPAKPKTCEGPTEFTRECLPRGGFGTRFIQAAFDEVEFSPGKRRGNRVRMRLQCTGKPHPCPEGPAESETGSQ